MQNTYAFCLNKKIIYLNNFDWLSDSMLSQIKKKTNFFCISNCKKVNFQNKYEFVGMRMAPSTQVLGPKTLGHGVPFQLDYAPTPTCIS